MADSVVGFAMVALAVAAGWFDVRERRVPNALTIPTLGIAFLIASFQGLPSLAASASGAVICFAVSIPFFLLRGLGGGDVKLLVVFGAFLGPSRIPQALLATAFVGGALGLWAMMRRGAVRRTFRNLLYMTATLFSRPGVVRDGEERDARWMTLESEGAITVPYAVAISAGALYGWFF